MPDLALSVVIPTYNRARLLERTLSSLDAQEGVGAPVEVIVVDDGSDDDTATVVANHPNVVYLRQENAGPAAARNRGWSTARGRIIAFTDDDTIPDPRWLCDLLRAFTADPDLDAAGGSIRPLTLSFLTRFVQAEQHASHGIGADGSIKYLVTANCAYRREVLAALGGFDEAFPAASGEDTDLTLRAQAAGYRMRLLGDALVLHDHPTTLRPIVRAYCKHGRSRRLVLDRNAAGRGTSGARDVFTIDHWRRRYRSYRQVGIGPGGAVAAFGLRLAGLAAYAVGMSESRRAARRPATATRQVAIACPGADHVARGYERVGRDLVALLGSDATLAVTLLKGSGTRRRGESVLPSLRRDRAVGRAISRLLSPSDPDLAAPRRRGRSWSGVLGDLVRRRVSVTPYDLEAATFGVSVLVHAAVHRPDLLVLQDVLTARIVKAGRTFVPGWRTKVLFVNGAPWPGPYPFADVVQHVTPVTWDADADADSRSGPTQVLLPLGTSVPDAVSPADAVAVRRRFGLPETGKIVVSVGTLLDHHKRHLHLIRELAQLPEPRPFLVIAGAPGPDQGPIEAAADALLGDGHRVLHLAPADVAALLSCADLFVLASVNEGFGLVYLEALGAGLPVIAHDGALQRWLLGRHGSYVDMAEPGLLADCVGQVLARDDRWSLDEDRRDYVRDRFSWASLRDDYLALVRQASGG